MLKTSGLILDVYDDFEGQTIRSFFPSMKDIPDMVKSAHALSQEERSRLPDSLHALVLIDGDQVLRKFACHDAGNTALSVLYFLKNASKLPVEAQAVAAENLKTACAWYGLDVPEELEKVSGVLGKAMFAMQLPGAYSNTKQNIKQNMAGIRGAESQGDMVATFDQMKGKHAEVSGTSDQPNTPPVPSKPKFPIKTASRMLNPYVDVTGKEPPRPVEKVASRNALGDKYPLDSYAQVKTASTYFSENWKFFSPEDRREYCSNLVKRAEELGISLPEDQRRYGGSTYAEDSTIKTAHFVRDQLILDEDERGVLAALFEKRAELDPELFAECLVQFDKAAGIDQYYGSALQDPYISVFGYEKTAEENWSEVEGGDLVTPQGLHRLAHHGFKTLRETFGEDMAVEFKKDPLGIYKSLPKDQKKLIAKMSADSALSTAP